MNNNFIKALAGSRRLDKLNKLRARKEAQLSLNERHILSHLNGTLVEVLKITKSGSYIWVKSKKMKHPFAVTLKDLNLKY